MGLPRQLQASLQRELPVPEGNSLRGWVKLLVVKSTDREGGRKGCGRGGGRGWRLSAPSAAWLVPGLCFACKQVVKSSLTQAPTCGGRRTHWNTGSGLAGGASEAWPLPPPGAAAETQQRGQPTAGATRLATERRSGSWGLTPSFGNAGPEAHSAARESRVLAPWPFCLPPAPLCRSSISCQGGVVIRTSGFHLEICSHHAMMDDISIH